jgi:transcriptional regulator with XRE-family HTH domain
LKRLRTQEKTCSFFAHRAVYSIMQTNHLPKLLLEVIAAQGISQRKLAEICGLSSSGISYLVNGGRPDAANLALIISKATDSHELRQRLVLAHLRDEVERAGHRPVDYSLMPASQVAQVAQVQSVAALHPGLVRMLFTALEVPELLATLLDLAALSARYETKAEPERHVADAPGPATPESKPVTYGKAPRKK